jgi:hypothetical protein
VNETNAYKVTIAKIDPDGNYLQDVMSINDALIVMLRFARKHPQSTCRIELHHTEPFHSIPGAHPVDEASLVRAATSAPDKSTPALASVPTISIVSVVEACPDQTSP